MKLEGKSAIITGAGRGLGRAVALAMAREGALTTIMSRSLDELNNVGQSIKELGKESVIIQGDVSRPDDVKRLVDETLERFSTIDILINNAAVTGPARFMEDADIEAWKETMDINLNGAFLCARNVTPIMARNGGGKIINITSGLGQMPFPRFCAYSVSKAGLIQLTRSLSEELKEMNIQVNAIAPGVMDTSMQDRIRALGASVLGEALHNHFMELKGKGELKEPEEVSSLTIFLASKMADHLTGHFGSLTDYSLLGWRP
ncbi:SDR family NAD(P)-dependent oxidoreductase [Thermodesulfobacteriota bacterium]